MKSRKSTSVLDYKQENSAGYNNTEIKFMIVNVI
jgi:hypothetical protein